ncbi:nuclear transport factor 2 family protein [Olivibacter sp. SA151]|uniref:nuclear transport factor 2 family protein n=1 Tax=Olivibacter jilunii TaxID=985016 RepID=UPI00059C9AD4
MYRYLIISAMVLMSCSNKARQSNQLAVKEAVEDFRQTMLHPDQSKFEALTSPLLTYGHSSGLIEDRETCIASMVNGKFKFLQIDLTEEKIDIEDKTAIVRHHFFARTHDAGKSPGTVNLKVLQVWHLHEGHWRLLARQAVRI